VGGSAAFGGCLGLLIEVCLYLLVDHGTETMKPIMIVGSYLSPYVGKVLVPEVKGMA